MTTRPEYADASPGPGIDLFWIPLGAGGVGFVRMNGRMYEAFKARTERRQPLRLYHTALEVRVPEGRYTIENAWPSPDGVPSRAVSLQRDRCSAIASRGSAPSATRFADGRMGSFRTPPRRLAVRSE